eukprot:363335-Chlamydomonas_euryale.AAC.1
MQGGRLGASTSQTPCQQILLNPVHLATRLPTHPKQGTRRSPNPQGREYSEVGSPRSSHSDTQAPEPTQREAAEAHLDLCCIRFCADRHRQSAHRVAAAPRFVRRLAARRRKPRAQPRLRLLERLLRSTAYAVYDRRQVSQTRLNRAASITHLAMQFAERGGGGQRVQWQA